MIFVFIPILGEYLTPQLVGGAQGVMIGNLIVNFFSGAQYTRGAAAALLIAALIVVLLVVFRRSLEVEDAVPCVSSRSSRRTRGSCAWLLGALGGARLRVPVRADRAARRCSASTRTGTARSRSPAGRCSWYGQVFHDYQIRDALTTTLKVAVAGDDHLDDRRHRGRVPARALAAAVPQRRARSA